MSNEEIISGLNPIAAGAATSFLEKFPGATLTSGRRDIAAQAHAMATDVVLDLDFVRKTYRHPLCLAAQQCQDWVDANCRVACQPLDVIAAAFLAIFRALPSEELDKLSDHLGGNAFDVAPDGDAAKLTYLVALAAAHCAAGGVAKFLSKEGNLVRWHFQAT